MNKQTNKRCFQRAFSGIPEDYSGSLLEAPVGTGGLSMPVYRALPRAGITCPDYSPKMMTSAQKRAARDGLDNARLVQGVVGALKSADRSFDIVFPERLPRFPTQGAVCQETFRVFKPGGTFCGGFYIAKKRRTDCDSSGIFPCAAAFSRPLKRGRAWRPACKH